MSGADGVDVLFDARHVASSGIGSYTRELLRHIPRWAEEDDVRVAVLGPAAVARRLPSPISFVEGQAPMYSPQEQLLLRSVLSSLNPRAYWSPHYPMPVLARVPSVVTVLDVLHTQPVAAGGPGGLRRVYAKAMLEVASRRAASIVTTSSFTAGELRRAFPRAEGRLTVSTFGIDDRWFEPVSPPPSARPYVVFVGNQKAHKNLPVLIEAFRLVKDDLPDLDLVLAGGGPNRTVDTRVGALIAPVADRVRVPGQLSFEALRDLVAGATALVLPSLYEGVGLPPLEAMAVGTPVIASRAGALPETCGPAAALIDPRSPGELAAALVRLHTDPGAHADAAARGREHVRARQATVAPRRAWEAALAAGRRRVSGRSA